MLVVQLVSHSLRRLGHWAVCLTDSPKGSERLSDLPSASQPWTPLLLSLYPGKKGWVKTEDQVLFQWECAELQSQRLPGGGGCDDKSLGPGSLEGLAVLMGSLEHPILLQGFV
jgi:hypothetical protein